jgi:hypothetical protein
MDFIYSVEHGLKRRWPKNLCVRRLEILGSLRESDLEYLSSIEFELELTLDTVAVEQMYQLLESMGRFVKSLTIANGLYCSRKFLYVKRGINLERILAACPNLEKLEYKTNRKVVREDKYNLPPSAFKNLKE